MTTATLDAGPLCSLALRFATGTGAAQTTAEYRDVIPLASGKLGAVVWFPHEHPTGHSAGFVRIETPDDVTTYSVSAAEQRGPVRVLFMTKAEGKGTDKRRSGYAVTCRDGVAVRCECSGATAHKAACKHQRAAESLLGNGWI